MPKLSVIIPIGPHEKAWQELLSEFLWFLHADSRFTNKTIPALLNSIKKAPKKLHYFNLQFNDNSLLLKLNNLGVWLRSHILGMPFGDQGFCIAKKLFTKIGGSLLI